MPIPLDREAPPSETIAPRRARAAGLRSRLPDITHAALRVVAGLMLVQHGVQKHFGLLLPAGSPSFGTLEPFSILWIAGALEIIGGLMLAIGLFTRPVAFVLSGLMASAYFIAHAPQGFWPTMNQGELAALYCFVFLAFAAIGGGPYSVDGAIAGHRVGRVVGQPRPTFRIRSGRDRRSAHVTY